MKLMIYLVLGSLAIDTAQSMKRILNRFGKKSAATPPQPQAQELAQPAAEGLPQAQGLPQPQAQVVLQAQAQGPSHPSAVSRSPSRVEGGDTTGNVADISGAIAASTSGVGTTSKKAWTTFEDSPAPSPTKEIADRRSTHYDDGTSVYTTPMTELTSLATNTAPREVAYAGDDGAAATAGAHGLQHSLVEPRLQSPMKDVRSSHKLAAQSAAAAAESSLQAHGLHHLLDESQPLLPVKNVGTSRHVAGESSASAAAAAGSSSQTHGVPRPSAVPQLLLPMKKVGTGLHVAEQSGANDKYAAIREFQDQQQ